MRAPARKMLRLGLLAFLGGLVLSPSLADAGRRKPAPEPVEEAAFTEEERAEAFQGFTEAISKGDTGGAMNALVAIVDNPEQEAFHGLAYAALGGLLKNQEYPYAALAAYSKAIELDPENNADSVQPALQAAGDVGDTALLEKVFASNVGLDVAPEVRSELAYLAARGSYARGNYSTSLGILSLVSKDSPNYAKGLALKGVVLAQQGKYTDAMAALLTAQALLQDDPEMLDVVNLNIARSYFAAENYARSSEFYAKVSRGSHWWPEAQFERAWAHFRMQDVNGALGMLQNHVSPFYQDWYFPEAQLLRTYSLFLICKFPEASRQIDDFQATWTPVRDELKTQIAAMDEVSAFKDARAYVGGGSYMLPELVLRDYAVDDRFAETVASVDQAKAELDRLQKEGTPWSQTASALVAERRQELVLTEGARIKSRAQAQVDELTTMLNDTEIAKLDMLKLETKLYEQAAVTGEMAEVERRAERKERIRKGYVSWPYEGEIWADELGYYRVETKPECPAGLMTGQ